MNQCWGNCYGIRTFTGGFTTVATPPALVADANDYLKVLRFANALFMIEGGTALNPHLGQSALLIMPWTTTAQFDGPAPVVLGNAADWLDFDVQDMSNGECRYVVFMVASYCIIRMYMCMHVYVCVCMYKHVCTLARKHSYASAHCEYVCNVVNYVRYCEFKC